METFMIILLVVVALLGGLNIYLVVKAMNFGTKNSEKEEGGLDMLLKQMNNLTNTVDQKIGQSQKDMQESFRHQSNESYKIIKDMTERLTKLDEANKQVVSLGDRIESLQNILKNPKQRGVLGEYYLETLLKNAMPPGSYQMQYQMGTDIVDAVVFVKDKIIPIDSKFSLENYNRIAEESDEGRKKEYSKAFVNDLKERVKETSKYIKPEDGTMEFAFMFIPHEAIYYDLLVNRIGDQVTGDGAENIIERAARQYKVIIVSPTSFLAYLQTVMQGLKALQLEENTKEIIKRVSELSRHIATQDKFMESLGKSLGTTVNHYEKAYSELKKMDKDVYRISEKSAGVEPVKLEKPEV